MRESEQSGTGNGPSGQPPSLPGTEPGTSDSLLRTPEAADYRADPAPRSAGSLADVEEIIEWDEDDFDDEYVPPEED